jgi:hypothetical protein
MLKFFYTKILNSGADPDPYVLGPPGSGFFHHQAKIERKTLIPTVLWLLYDFWFLKNDVDARVRIRIKTSQIRNTGEGSNCSTVGYLRRILLASSRSITNSTNSRIRVHWSKARIRIRSNISRIRKTGFERYLLLQNVKRQRQCRHLLFSKKCKNPDLENPTGSPKV